MAPEHERKNVAVAGWRAFDRIDVRDFGLWKDRHIELSRFTRFFVKPEMWDDVFHIERW